MTDQAIWNGLTGGWGQRQLPWAFLSNGPPPPRHPHVPDSSQHPLRRYLCVSLFDRGGHSCPAVGTEILSKVKERRAWTPGCGCCSTAVAAVGRNDNGCISLQPRRSRAGSLQMSSAGCQSSDSHPDFTGFHRESPFSSVSLTLEPSPAFSVFALKPRELPY